MAIYVGSERSAERVFASISQWIEKYLKLTINRDKSGTGRPWERKFLGFHIKQDGEIGVAKSSLEAYSLKGWPVVLASYPRSGCCGSIRSPAFTGANYFYMSMTVMYRFCVGLLVLGLLGGCSGQSTFSSATDLLELGVFGNTEVAYSDDYVRNLPYASISVKIGKGQKSLLVLGKIEANQYYWYSADRAMLVTESGRIVKTRGLETDLLVSRSLTPDPLMAIQGDVDGEQLLPGQSATESYTRLLDFSRHEVFGVAQRFSLRRVSLQPGGAERVELLGEVYTADRYEERFEVQALDWSGTNQYWVDAQMRRLLKSVQFFAPDSPSVAIEYLSIISP